ncbi:MAG: nucleotidyl transferase AbiEii/AbiGii toxin family protein [Betaproteobacteria bacterium]|nr:nucleotidyl transferase AbiEii/AbiGii toxin family protein [Betaproteobacteria bacterium]
MAEDRLRIWEVLFQRALVLIDSVEKAGITLSDWSFGGGTVLMRRYRHRFSKDVDIFILDPQYLGYLSPHLNDTAEEMTDDYTLQANFLKLQFPEGEIDFVVSAPLTKNPTISETIFDRKVQVETSTEIVAKKVWHRGDRFRARDLFDLALIAEKEPAALTSIGPVLRDRRDVVTAWLAAKDRELRDDFANLEILEHQRTYDECLAIVKKVFKQAG